jgi:hypothetical protein
MATDVFDVMAKMEGSSALSLPPPSFEEAEAEIIEYTEGKSIVGHWLIWSQRNQQRVSTSTLRSSAP